MNPETIKALQDSIAHWERMRDDRMCGEKPTGNECPLCDLFVRGCDVTVNCQGCPVMEHTGLAHCDETPYCDAADFFLFGTDDDWRKYAQAEIDFLRSLLPASKLTDEQ